MGLYPGGLKRGGGGGGGGGGEVCIKFGWAFILDFTVFLLTDLALDQVFHSVFSTVSKISMYGSLHIKIRLH